ncbi:uncharacterized protein FOMMEDRAFT_162091 [Fomitiporia mediterranea MF3/22]|uniref:uncharacterized protein n=1 Tax=Fomitiporia mediterranea (strain MF3/22) TaxID=694068 RepID=UPI0004408317|nr:uncharacterized protein FOMMEDRAFT_162091 [Fomitiporia mediterranea MF3/22]EJC98300.1 hypothetical protein FOMMEDRAFT_162091 [Fomitiporia mediterranea MF3/22]
MPSTNSPCESEPGSKDLHLQRTSLDNRRASAAEWICGGSTLTWQWLCNQCCGLLPPQSLPRVIASLTKPSAHLGLAYLLRAFTRNLNLCRVSQAGLFPYIVGAQIACWNTAFAALGTEEPVACVLLLRSPDSVIFCPMTWNSRSVGPRLLCLPYGSTLFKATTKFRNIVIVVRFEMPGRCA